MIKHEANNFSFNEMRLNKRHVKRRGLVIAITAIFTGFLLACLVLKENNENMDEDNFRFALQQYFPDDVSCYYEEDIEDDYWKKYINNFKSTDVYFHWTPCGYTIKLVHLCAIEAASRAYPNDKVYVLFCKPLKFTIAQRKLLNNFLEYLKSVKFVRISVISYCNETPLETMIEEFINSDLTKKHKRLEDALKITTLYRNGGIVVDTDVIVTDIPDIPDHWLVREKKKIISSSMLSFKIDKAVLLDGSKVMLDAVFKNYTLSRFLTDRYNICTKQDGCDHIKVLDEEIVNVKYTDKARKIPPAFAYRVSDKIYERRIPNNSLLDIIAKKYCPFVYSQSYLFK